ncbi:MAG TPA: NfeD family protein, partial [Fibrobacteraceae bacterium]|nr:NfeD family protein [Fibrobacteraceae bacterium]
AKFRNLAQRNHYPELLSQAMVTPELEVVKVQKGDSIRYLDAKDYDELTDLEKAEWGPKKTLVRETELLTLTDVEAVEMGFSQATLPDDAALKKALGIQSSREVKISWAETLARWLGTISPILMLLAFGALYLEYQTPGFGMFGIAGIALLAVVFGGQYVSGLADKLPLALLLLGIALVLLEVLVFPGTWIAGVAALGFFAAALIVAFLDSQNTMPLPAVPGLALDGLPRVLAWVLGSALVAMVFPVVASRYVLTHLPQSYSPILGESLMDASSPREIEAPLLKVGDVGETINLLKPNGKCRFGEHIVEAQSRDGFLEIGTPVRVTAVEGHRILVARENV